MLDHNTLSRHIRPLAPIPTSLSPRGTVKADIRAVLFDIYGTLFVSASGDISIVENQRHNVRRLRQLLDAYRIGAATGDVLKDFVSAVKHDHEQAIARGIDYPEVQIDHIWKQVLGFETLNEARKFAAEFELFVNPIYPMPHLKQVLDFIKNRKHLRMGVISNAQFYTPLLFEWFFDSSAEKLGFDPDLTVFSYESGHAKPSPVLFQKAVYALSSKSITPESVLYIGNDMLNDILPAKRAGFQAALFAGDTRSLRLRADHPECADLSPNLVITDLQQLIELLR